MASPEVAMALAVAVVAAVAALDMNQVDLPLLVLNFLWLRESDRLLLAFSSFCAIAAGLLLLLLLLPVVCPRKTIEKTLVTNLEILPLAAEAAMQTETLSAKDGTRALPLNKIQLLAAMMIASTIQPGSQTALLLCQRCPRPRSATVFLVQRPRPKPRQGQQQEEETAARPRK